MRQPLLATLAIMFAFVATFPQKRTNHELAGINGPVRTVRIEGRQLHAVTYHQWGVMVYTIIYDDKGRLLEYAEYLPGGNPDTKSTSTYDERGNKIEHAYYLHDELSHRSTTKYDSRNRKIEQLTFDASGKQTGKFIFQYDKRGRQVALEVQPNGRMKKRSVAVLDGRGNELERTEYNQSGAAEGRYVYRYDDAGNKTSEVHFYKQKGGTRTSKRTYVYDGNGNLSEEALYFDGVLDNRKTFTRDACGNQIEAVDTDDKGQVKVKRTWHYEFDSDGNWTRALITEWTNKAPNAPLQPTYEYRRIFGRHNDGTIALWGAARQGNTERVQELLRDGADVNANHPDGGTSLIKAATQGHVETVQALLTAGAELDRKDTEGWTALAWSAEYGRIEIVRMLLAAGADPNARNEVGGVPIMPAALNGHIEVLKLLLESGAEVNLAACDGSTALMVSAQKRQTKAVRLLLATGADPDLKTNDAQTAVFFAAAGGNIDTVKAILDKGVDVNAKTNDGTTPLMVASANSDLGVLKLLIDSGADINAKTADGKTALSFAVQANNKEGAELLRKAGAK